MFPIELRRSASLDVQLPKPVTPAFKFPRCHLQGASGSDTYGDVAPTSRRRILIDAEPCAKELGGLTDPASGDDRPRVERPPSSEVAGDDVPAGTHFRGMWTLQKVLQPGEMVGGWSISTLDHPCPAHFPGTSLPCRRCVASACSACHATGHKLVRCAPLASPLTVRACD